MIKDNQSTLPGVVLVVDFWSNTPHKYAAATFVPREYIQSGPVNVYIVGADNRGRRGWAWQICWDGCL